MKDLLTLISFIRLGMLMGAIFLITEGVNHGAGLEAAGGVYLMISALKAPRLLDLLS